MARQTVLLSSLLRLLRELQDITMSALEGEGGHGKLDVVREVA